MTRYRFYVGTRTKDGQAVNPEEWGDVNAYLINKFGGYTQTTANGAWADNKGIVFEASRVYECLDEHSHVRDDTRTFGLMTAKRIACITHQTAVLYTVEVVDGGLTRA